MYDKGNLIQKINMKLCRKIIYFIYCYSNGRNDTLEHSYTSFYFVVKVIMLFINLITGMHFFWKFPALLTTSAKYCYNLS